MTNLKLAPEELTVLEQLLERSISDLTIEVAHTDSHAFKERLKQRKVTLDQLLNKVREAALPA